MRCSILHLSELLLFIRLRQVILALINKTGVCAITLSRLRQVDSLPWTSDVACRLCAIVWAVQAVRTAGGKLGNQLSSACMHFAASCHGAEGDFHHWECTNTFTNIIEIDQMLMIRLFSYVFIVAQTWQNYLHKLLTQIQSACTCCHAASRPSSPPHMPSTAVLHSGISNDHMTHQSSAQGCRTLGKAGTPPACISLTNVNCMH